MIIQYEIHIIGAPTTIPPIGRADIITPIKPVIIVKIPMIVK